MSTIFLSIFSSSFTQLLQQTGVVEQLQQSGRAYTLFVPTNAALQSIGVTTNMNRIRQVNCILEKAMNQLSRFTLVCSSSYLC